MFWLHVMPILAESFGVPASPKRLPHEARVAAPLVPQIKWDALDVDVWPTGFQAVTAAEVFTGPVPWFRTRTILPRVEDMALYKPSDTTIQLYVCVMSATSVFHLNKSRCAIYIKRLQWALALKQAHHAVCAAPKTTTRTGTKSSFGEFGDTRVARMANRRCNIEIICANMLSTAEYYTIGRSGGKDLG